MYNPIEALRICYMQDAANHGQAVKLDECYKQAQRRVHSLNLQSDTIFYDDLANLLTVEFKWLIADNDTPKWGVDHHEPDDQVPTREDQDTQVVQIGNPRDHEIIGELIVGMRSLESMKHLFRNVRGAQDDTPSVIDAISIITGYDSDYSGKIFRRMQKTNDLSGIVCQRQFPGEGQRKTPIAHWPKLLMILTYVPGKKGDYIRSQASKLLCRIYSGDRSIAKSVLDMADHIEGTVTLTTSTAIPKEMVCHETLQAHERLAKQHVNSKRGSDEQDMRMLFSKVQKTGDTFSIHSEWLTATIMFDEAWDCMMSTGPMDETVDSVYAIRMAKSDLVKIGHSINVQRRLSCLQVGCPMDLHLEFASVFLDAKQSETKIHAHLDKQGKNVRGEWYNLSRPLDMFAILRECGL